MSTSGDGSSFGTTAMLEVEVDEQSLRNARSTIEERAGSVRVGSRQAATDGGRGFATERASRERAMSRQHLSQQAGMLDEIGDDMEASHELALERNELLEDILDAVDDGALNNRGGGGGGGGGVLSMLGLRSVAGGAGGGGAALGTGALSMGAAGIGALLGLPTGAAAGGLAAEVHNEGGYMERDTPLGPFEAYNPEGVDQALGDPDQQPEGDGTGDGRRVEVTTEDIQNEFDAALQQPDWLAAGIDMDVSPPDWLSQIPGIDTTSDGVSSVSANVTEPSSREVERAGIGVGGPDLDQDDGTGDGGGNQFDITVDNRFDIDERMLRRELDRALDDIVDEVAQRARDQISSGFNL